jgi:hypothetical protein
VSGCGSGPERVVRGAVAPSNPGVSPPGMPTRRVSLPG